MTAFGLMIVILGAASVSVNLVRLIDRLDHPTAPKTYKKRMAH